MMRLLLTSTLAVMLVACGGGGSSSQPVPPPPPPPPPAEGTVLSEECDGYTLVREIADGKGGSTTERTVESNECGWIPPEFNVAIDDEFGDRFKPVVITVEYTVQGEPAEWTYDTDLRAEKDGDTLRVWGNGQREERTVLINDEPFLIQLSEEPRCGKVDLQHDCQGYHYSGRTDGLIYYGEDDTQVVDFELVILLYSQSCGVIREDIGYLCEDEITEDRLKNWQYRVDKYNEVFEQSGIYARFVLKGAYYTSSGSLSQGKAIARALGADISIGWGTTCPATCGCAYAYNTYNSPGFGWSVCGWDTDLHEMGHAIGLAHGPENSNFPAYGYLFRDFGHGWMDDQCSRKGDLMSYSSSAQLFLNSTKTCDESYGDGNTETLITDRSYSDTAYHWNRVRYDVSLVNDEYDEGTVKSLREVPAMDEPIELILD